MDLYILRHGIAVERGSGGYKDDSLRPLTKEGIQKTKDVSKGMLKAEAAFDLILTSPYKRALQTAQIVAEKFQMKKNLFIVDALASGGSPETLIDFINHEYGDEKNLLLVGHEPDLSSLISLLTTGDDTALFNLKKAGLAKLHIDKLRRGQCGSLDYFLSPKLLIKLSKSK